MVHAPLHSVPDANTPAASTARIHTWEIETAADPLIELELRVARRADELARSAATQTSLNLRHWLEAEQEILQPLIDCFAPQPQSSARSAPWRSAANN